MYIVVATLVAIIVGCAHGQNTQNGLNGNILNNLISSLSQQTSGGRGVQGAQAGLSSTDTLNQGSCGKQQQQASVGSGELTGVIALLLQNILNNHQNKPQADPKEQEMLKLKEMGALADMVIEILDFKQKEADFANAMGYLCLYVNATIEAYKKNNTAVYRVTTEAMMAEMYANAKTMTDEEKYAFVIETMKTNEILYAEIFLRLAAQSCYTGGEYAKALEAKNSNNE